MSENREISERDWRKPGRRHAFGMKGDGKTSWHVVFDSEKELEEWITSHPSFIVYSRWLSEV